MITSYPAILPAGDPAGSGFNGASMAGVEKWKFRPGVRNGKVNPRTRVPISFKLADQLN